MILQSFLLGMTQGVVCTSICLPVIGTYLLGTEKKGIEALRIFILFLLGRFSGYMCIAVIAALLGKIIFTSAVLSMAFSLAYIVIGILMIFYGVTRFSQSHLCLRLKSSYDSPSYMFMAGLITGCNICPPFLGMILISLEKGSLLRSIISFSSFFVATSLYLLPVVMIGRLSHYRMVRLSAVLASMVIGVVFVFKGVNMFL